VTVLAELTVDHGSSVARVARWPVFGRFGMALSITGEDARDLDLQREIHKAFEVFSHAAGEERSTAKIHYLKLLKAFTARVQQRQPIEERLGFLLGLVRLQGYEEAAL